MKNKENNAKNINENTIEEENIDMSTEEGIEKFVEELLDEHPNILKSEVDRENYKRMREEEKKNKTAEEILHLGKEITEEEIENFVEKCIREEMSENKEKVKNKINNTTIFNNLINSKKTAFLQQIKLICRNILKTVSSIFRITIIILFLILEALLLVLTGHFKKVKLIFQSIFATLVYCRKISYFTELSKKEQKQLLKKIFPKLSD